MNKKILFRRHGDLNFHPVSKKEFETLKKTAEKVETKTKIVLQEGETTGHKHVLTQEDITNMEAYKLPDGSWLLRAHGSLTHEDHKKIDLAPTYYREVRERELDHFKDSVVRRVID